MRGKPASGTKHARIREIIYRFFEHGKSIINLRKKTDLLRDFSKELSALFASASVNSLSPIIENGLLFGSLRL